MTRYQITGRTAAEIASSLEHAVHTGSFAPGEALPTVRSLAASLEVSPGTVAAAYKLLRSRTLVTGQGRHGTRVASHPPTPAAVAIHRVPAGAIDLATGNPDPALLPPLASALHAVSREPRLYGAPPSMPALVRFAASEFDADGIRGDTLTVVSGGLDGIDLVLREHLRPGDHVGVEDPVFPGLIDLLAAARLVPLPFAVDDDGPRPDAFEGVLKKRCHAVIVTPRAQNPTGEALTAARVQDLRRILRKHPQTLVVEDDYAGPIAGAPAFTLCASMSRWAVIRSMAKFLGPDLRVAVVAGDPVTVARVEGRQALGMRWVSYILQQLALALWSDPASGRQLAHAANVYRQRREALLGALSKRGIHAHGRSGFNVWIPVPEEARVVHSLAASGWAVASGERFRLRTPPGIRVTTATLAPADADTLGEALSEVLPQRATAFA